LDEWSSPCRDTPHGKNGEDQGRQGRILLTAPERRPKKRQDRKECQGVPSGHGGKKRAESEHANDCGQQNDGKRFGVIGPLPPPPMRISRFPQRAFEGAWASKPFVQNEGAQECLKAVSGRD